MPEPEREPVFIAANVREADFVEQLLDEAGIEYEERLEAFMREELASAVCYQGTLFEVLEGQADDCRRLLTEKGLGRGIV
jgi:hypothetical protein